MTTYIVSVRDGNGGWIDGGQTFDYDAAWTIYDTLDQKYENHNRGHDVLTLELVSYTKGETE